VIVDVVANLKFYRGLHPRLDKGLDYLKSIAGWDLADGRYELSGMEVYANVATYETLPPASKPYEAHRAYIDLQYVLAGKEGMFWAPLDELSTTTEYSGVEDIAYFTGPDELLIPLEPGRFVILFPWDAHKPGCCSDQLGVVKKLVIKILFALPGKKLLLAPPFGRNLDECSE